VSRKIELLTKAAEALEEMRDPFSHEFLVENNVTADECFYMSDILAASLRT
jgi:hypothetical protein